MCARVSSTTRSSCAAIVPGDRDLHEREVARNGRHVAQVLDLQHVDQLVQVRGDAVDTDLVAVDDDRHARDAGHVGAADGQRFDVEGTAPEQQTRRD